MNFEVREGEIFGFLGAVRRRKKHGAENSHRAFNQYAGSVQVNGIEVKHHDNSFYENIGWTSNFRASMKKLTARENLKFFGSLYQKQQSTLPLLESVGLLGRPTRSIDYSKGMKSRLNFIKALLHDRRCSS
jgi:fluoroquinolone transport system ATP-binding protein